MNNNLREAEQNIGKFMKAFSGLSEQQQKVADFELKDLAHESRIKWGFNIRTSEKLSVTHERVRQIRERIGLKLRALHRRGEW